MAALNYSDVSKLLKADFETGKLFWLPRPVDMFPRKRVWAAWNTRYAGGEAFTSISAQGYKQGKVCGVQTTAHRVIWLLFTKELPSKQIDHLNGVRTDNRISNLRHVSNAENHRNMRRHKDNTSGATGVSWCPQKRKWHVRLYSDGRSKFLGYFGNREDAIAARKAADAAYGFHENHGNAAHQSPLEPLSTASLNCPELL